MLAIRADHRVLKSDFMVGPFKSRSTRVESLANEDMTEIIIPLIERWFIKWNKETANVKLRKTMLTPTTKMGELR